MRNSLLLFTILILALPMAAWAKTEHAPEAGKAQASMKPATMTAQGGAFTPTLPSPQVSPKAVTPPHELKGVRLKPLADSLRVIFLLDGATPYTLREDPAHQRAELDLINAKVAYLPADLARVEDPRLSGIWLKQLDPGLVTLELRFPSTQMRVEHFALTDPPAIVLDLYRTDLTAVQLAPVKAAKASTDQTSPTQPTLTPLGELKPARAQEPVVTPVVGSHGSVVPTFEMDPATTESTLPSPKETPALPPQAVESEKTPAVPLQAVESKTTSTLVVNSDTPTSRPMAALPGVNREETSSTLTGEMSNLNISYDFFPVSALRTSSSLAEEIRQDFLGHRWANVIEKGMQYLKLNRINQETSSVLYMMAEAKWQLGNSWKHPPYRDMMNFYQQALRTHSGDDLGAFGNWRMAQICSRMQDHLSASTCLDRAMGSTERVVRERALLLKIQTLGALRDYGQALALGQGIEQKISDPGSLVKFYVQEGTIRLDQGDAEGAWGAFEKATAVDPKWTSMDPAGCENMAKAALQSNRLAQAREYLEYLNQSFPHRGDSEAIKLSLLYADVLARQGDTATAEATYAELLIGLGATNQGAAIQKRMLQLHPDVMTEGEGRYCMLLWRQGKIKEAMKELNRAYQQCLREGIPTTSLDPLVSTILPPFMERSAALKQSLEVVQGWRIYNHTIKDLKVRRRCQKPLADALEDLGLYRDAIDLIEQLRQDSVTSTSLASSDLDLQEARLHRLKGSPKKAIPLLEGVLALNSEPAMEQSIYQELAKVYLANGQPLEAAQAYQSLANTAGVDSPAMGDALLQAGEIFLKQGMPMQTIELALKALIYERQMHEQMSEAGWPASTGIALRLILARAYLAREDTAREAIILEDILKQPKLTKEEKAQARLMLGDAYRMMGRTIEAEQIYQEQAGDDKTPEPWRGTASQALKVIQWNREHPQWKVKDQTASKTK